MLTGLLLSAANRINASRFKLPVPSFLRQSYNSGRITKKKKTQQKHEGKKKTLVVFLCVYVGRKGEEDEF